MLARAYGGIITLDYQDFKNTDPHFRGDDVEGDFSTLLKPLIL